MPDHNQKSAATRARAPTGRLGVWVFGIHGGLATTLVVGTKAIARGLCSSAGLVTESPWLAEIGFAPLKDIVFGGHDIRKATVLGSAREIQRETGTIPYEVIERLAPELRAVDGNVRMGTALNCGRTIQALRASPVPGDRRPVRSIVRAIQSDIRAFAKRNRLRRVVAVNLASTEPLLRLGDVHRSLDALEDAIDRDESSTLRASTLYAYAAADLSLPFLQFTASNGALVPAVEELFERRGAPYMGFDGKTGETLVKSALSPMFKYRNLRVLAWQGYNILGDRDGAVLADESNKRAKISTKDHLLTRILGYPLHTHVGIDYVPSLKDMKTAWDFIHFQGFLDFKMSMQFIWQGCDAILAAPIVLDMVRFADLAGRLGEKGRMLHLSCYFKKPLGVDEHDLHVQWHHLTGYVERHRAVCGNARPDGGARARGTAHRRRKRSSTSAAR